MTRAALGAGAALLVLGPLLSARTRAALFLAFLAGVGCASPTERCLTAADVQKDLTAHKLCHGYTWAACPPAQKQAVEESYQTEQALCRPVVLTGAQ